jgi:hypothetical protein
MAALCHGILFIFCLILISWRNEEPIGSEQSKMRMNQPGFILSICCAPAAVL